jgi:hypothetical protein
MKRNIVAGFRFVKPELGKFAKKLLLAFED